MSPLLANIVLNELDRFVEDELIPEYTKGTRRKRNPEYAKLASAAYRAKQKGDWKRAKALRKVYMKIPYGLSNDPDFRRLWDVRYADDVLFGSIGPKSDAQVIKQQFGEFLHRIKLDLSEEKTLITHARTSKARFLNYEIHVMQANHKTEKNHSDYAPFRKRTVNGQIWFSIPEDVVERWKAKVRHAQGITYRAELLHRSDYDIVSTDEIELQGLINYYSRVHNGERLRYLRHAWEESLTKTLAAKHKTTVSTICQRYKTFITAERRKLVGVEIPRAEKKPLRAIFGRKPIQREKGTVIQDTRKAVYTPRNGIITRFLAGRCELCGKEGIRLEGHQVKKLKDLQRRWKGRKQKPQWVKQMIAIRRKTLFVCPECHKTIHRGEYDGSRLT